jgi:hypothetical protein
LASASAALEEPESAASWPTALKMMGIRTDTPRPSRANPTMATTGVVLNTTTASPTTAMVPLTRTRAAEPYFPCKRSPTSLTPASQTLKQM